MIKELSISGFRGFGEEQRIMFAIPDGDKQGSGLTIITGSNNSGKTSVIEAIRAFNGQSSPSFSEGKRNLQTEGQVSLAIKDEHDKTYTIASVKGGGSSTQKSEAFDLKFYVVQSRRAIQYEFGRSNIDRNYYISNAMNFQSQRSAYLEQFESRIFQLEKDSGSFNPVLKKVLGSDIEWAVEQRDSGNYYIKYTSNGVTHSSEGVGDGIWSIFTICASLYDAPDKSTVVIDEPELSVHPHLQKKLMELFLEYSQRIQIIICTHSPYFVNWKAILAGAILIRIAKEGSNSKCYTIDEAIRDKCKKYLEDISNPHVLGLEANEIFFLRDGIILVEGQEDVHIYRKIAEDLGMSFEGEFYGWGAGGASKMETFLTMFKSLGYKKVVAILDGDQKQEKAGARHTRGGHGQPLRRAQADRSYRIQR